MLMRQGKVDIVDYDTKTYYRIEYTDSFSGAYVWFVRRRGEDYIRQVRDVNVYGVLEDYYQKQVMKQIEEYPYKKYTPDEVADEVEWDEKDNPPYRITDEVVNKMLKKWEENPPDFLKFELGKTLETLITRWWDDVYDGIHQDWDKEVAIDDLIDQIQLWLPKEQSHEGTQDASVIDLVDGYNDCLEKIKSKLRNKK
jgi:hypothetical protein